jgi:hypothetical protein
MEASHFTKCGIELSCLNDMILTFKSNKKDITPEVESLILHFSNEIRKLQIDYAQRIDEMNQKFLDTKHVDPIVPKQTAEIFAESDSEYESDPDDSPKKKTPASKIPQPRKVQPTQKPQIQPVPVQKPQVQPVPVQKPQLPQVQQQRKPKNSTEYFALEFSVVKRAYLCHALKQVAIDNDKRLTLEYSNTLSALGKLPDENFSDNFINIASAFGEQIGFRGILQRIDIVIKEKAEQAQRHR